ncbi:hypothetical protein [Kiloniella spongiae]|uniref:hypothetical protein n=1 Tax=Kiloniella spongiae TaxID=1489064 RepID=UPI0012E01829|nr:hypothetical protein [Kiloniella spongiae]
MKKDSFLSMLILGCVIFAVISKVGAQISHVSLFDDKLESSISNKRVLMVKNGEKISKFRIVDLEKLPLYEVFLPPVWENEAGKYQGVLLSDILKASEMADVDKVKLVALGGYAIDLALSMWPANCLFVATRHQMHEIRVKMKGPIRLLLPCMIKEEDGETNYTEMSTASWIWNLKEIHVLD